MESPLTGHHALDINATSGANQSIVPGLLAAHAISGCDSVASYYGIGKGKALKVLKKGKYKLSLLGMSEYWRLIDQASRSLLACYSCIKSYTCKKVSMAL